MSVGVTVMNRWGYLTDESTLMENEVTPIRTNGVILVIVKTNNRGCSKNKMGLLFLDQLILLVQMNWITFINKITLLLWINEVKSYDLINVTRRNKCGHIKTILEILYPISYTRKIPLISSQEIPLLFSIKTQSFIVVSFIWIIQVRVGRV